MDWDWSVIANYRDLLWSGLEQTLVLWVVSSAIGFGWGLVLGMCRLSRRAVIRIPARLILEVLRGIPLIVLLLWLYFAFPLVLGSSLSPFVAAVAGLSLYGGSYYGEVIRGGIVGLDPGQDLAAMSLGMTYFERMRRIILPQAFRAMVPPLANQTIIQLKNTAQASVVTAPELLYQANEISATTYRPLVVYTSVALVFLIIVIPTSMLARRLEMREGIQPRRSALLKWKDAWNDRSRPGGVGDRIAPEDVREPGGLEGRITTRGGR